MKEYRLFKNYLFNLSYQLLNMIIPLITTPYVSRVLGAENIGIYGYTNSIVTYFVLFASAGINIYGQRSAAYIQNDRMRRSVLFWEITIIKFGLSAVTGISYWILFANKVDYRSMYRVLFIAILGNGFDIAWFFQGLENFKKTAVRNIIVRFIGVMAIFVLVRDTNDLILYTLCYMIPTLIGNISLWIYLPEYLERAGVKLNNCKKHLRPIAALFVPQVAMEIYIVLDKTMLGYMTTDIAETGYYEQAQKIVKFGVRFLTAFGAVMLTRMSNTYAEKGEKGVKDNLPISFQFTFFLGIPVMFGCMGVAENMVPWFFGNGYEKVIPLMIIIAPIVMAIGFSNILGTQYLIPTNRQGIYTVSILAGAISNFVLNLLFIPHWGCIGAAVASVIAEWTVTFVQLGYVHKRVLINVYLKKGKNNIIAGIVMLVMVFLTGCQMKEGILCTITQLIVGVIVYLGVLYLMKDEFFINILKKMSEMNF